MLDETGRRGSQKQAATRAATASGAKPRLLVIDDDKMHRMIVCRAADRVGYAPAGAATAREAVRLLQGGRFDCIALDLSFGQDPDMLRQLAALGSATSIVVIGDCDAAGGEDAAATSLRLNVVKTIAKPVDLDVLQAALVEIKDAQVPESAAEA